MFTRLIVITIVEILFCDIIINFNLISMYDYSFTTGICLVVSAVMAYYYIRYIFVDLAKIVLIVMISSG